MSRIKMIDLHSLDYHVACGLGAFEGTFIVIRKTDNVSTKRYGHDEGTAVYKELKALHRYARAGFNGACAAMFAREGKSPPCITITVKGGMVEKVTGLPEGWTYEIDDKDNF